MEEMDGWNGWAEVNRWTDGTDGLSGQVDRHEQMDKWNGWTDGTDGQMEYMDRSEQVDRCKQVEREQMDRQEYDEHEQM